MAGKLIVITGPTACGKTQLTVNLAQQLNTEIVSADSRQFYKEMAIGTAKPTPSEMAGVPHHFIDSHSIHAPVSAGEYEKLALEKLHTLFKQHSHVILTGGSGLFIDAVVNGFDHMPPRSESLRNTLNTRLETEGLKTLVAELQQRDPEYAQEADLQNPKRVIRALEVCIQSGATFSELRKSAQKKRPFDTLKIALDRPREELYERINSRVHLMMNQGLEQEARSLLPYRHLTALNTVGYKELFSYFDHEITQARAIELIQQNSRRYAKRQLTWFRRSEDYHWIHPDNYAQIHALITAF